MPTLRALHRRGVRLGVVSDTGFDLRPVFEALGLSPYLATVVLLSFQHGVCKPDPSVFLTACHQLDVLPAETLMVGDNPHTDAGAVFAGVSVFLLPPPARIGPRGLGRVLSLAAIS